MVRPAPPVRVLPIPLVFGSRRIPEALAKASPAPVHVHYPSYLYVTHPTNHGFYMGKRAFSMYTTLNRPASPGEMQNSTTKKPDCRIDRFVVRHIFVAAGGGNPIRAAWALYKDIMTT